MSRILYRLIAALARFAVRSGRSKDLELIVLRHQLGVLRRQIARPELTNNNNRTLLGAIAAALPRPQQRRTTMPAFWNNWKQLAMALIAWNVFDVVLHVFVDQVEPLRITGNIVALVAGAVIGWSGISDAQKASVAVVAVLAVLGLNVAWALDEGKWWPPIATILITGAFVLLSRLAALSTKAATASTAT